MVEISHRVLNHPADMGLEINAPDLNRLFEEAASALTGVLVDLDSKTPTVFEEQVEVSGRDIEDLLFQWLSEILFLFDCEGRVYSRMEVEVLRGDSDQGADLKARLYGEELESHQVKTYVKAITLHQLKIEEIEGGFSATVYLDV